MIIYMELWQFGVWLAVLPLLISVWWLFTNRKFLSDKFNLRFRRARVVQTRLHTASGAVIERFVVPNADRFVKLDSGKATGYYILEPDFSERNHRFNVPCYDIVELQIQPALPKVGIAKGEMKVTKGLTDKLKIPPIFAEVKGKDGGIKHETRQVETVHLHFRRSFPQKLQLLNNGAQIAAHEVHNLMQSHIVERMALAQAEMIKRVHLTFILVCVTLGVVVLSGIIDYSYLKGISDKMGTLFQIALRSATTGTGVPP